MRWRPVSIRICSGSRGRPVAARLRAGRAAPAGADPGRPAAVPPSAAGRRVGIFEWHCSLVPDLLAQSHRRQDITTQAECPVTADRRDNRAGPTAQSSMSGQCERTAQRMPAVIAPAITSSAMMPAAPLPIGPGDRPGLGDVEQTEQHERGEQAATASPAQAAKREPLAGEFVDHHPAGSPSTARRGSPTSRQALQQRRKESTAGEMCSSNAPGSSASAGCQPCRRATAYSRRRNRWRSGAAMRTASFRSLHSSSMNRAQRGDNRRLGQRRRVADAGQRHHAHVRCAARMRATVAGSRMSLTSPHTSSNGRCARPPNSAHRSGVVPFSSRAMRVSHTGRSMPSPPARRSARPSRARPRRRRATAAAAPRADARPPRQIWQTPDRCR